MRSPYDWCSGSKTGIGLKETYPLSFNEKVSYNIFTSALTTLEITRK
jgi:hypothetical protein